MRYQVVFASALALLFAASPVWSYSSEDQAACTPDVFRLCGAVIPDEGRIVACLAQNKPHLSVGCHKVFDRETSTRPMSRAPIETENRRRNGYIPETTGSGWRPEGSDSRWR